MKTRTVYEVTKYRQRLISGNWKDPDCEWYWEPKSVHFNTLKEAKSYLDSLTLGEDVQIAELVKLVIETDANGYELRFDETHICWKD